MDVSVIDTPALGDRSYSLVTVGLPWSSIRNATSTASCR